MYVLHPSRRQRHAIQGKRYVYWQHFWAKRQSVTCRRKDALKGLRKISGISVDKEELLVGVVGFFLHLKLSELKSLDLTF